MNLILDRHWLHDLSQEVMRYEIQALCPNLNNYDVMYYILQGAVNHVNGDDDGVYNELRRCLSSEICNDRSSKPGELDRTHAAVVDRLSRNYALLAITGKLISYLAKALRGLPSQTLSKVSFDNGMITLTINDGIYFPLVRT